ncbi:hypothetical protein [Gilliamella sp. wkB112]|uniref:hypothetical protein n=1 Tax=Gilliamella sp. wkB112 TaxID=3120257 RepID=UPI00080E32B3|nr:hypothetical protein [Gilliamella apicola]OCG00809.1 hypothetical protein A9G12_03325 [Gilliamella apicola]
MFKRKLVYIILQCLFIQISISVLIISSNAYAETVKSDNKDHFDVVGFNKNKDTSSNEWSYTLDDGTYIRKFKSTDGYIEQISKATSPYNVVRAYNEKGDLVEKLTQFYSMKIKLEQYKNSKIIKLDDYSSFKVSIDDLRILIEQKFNIDIMNPKQIARLNRYILPRVNSPVYELQYYAKSSVDIVHCVLIDGVNGDILYQTERSNGSRQKELTIYDEYLQSIKK